MAKQVKLEIPIAAEPQSKMGSGVPDTTVEFFTEVRKPPIRSTPLSVLDECPRKFLYAFKLGIKPKTVERPLSLGSFLHLALKGLFLGKTETEALAAVDTALAKHVEQVTGWADPAGFLPWGKDLKAVLSSLNEDYHKARAMALVFWRSLPFATADYEVLCDPEGTPMVEVLLEAHIKGLSMPLRCPCDLALISKKTGEVWIVDFKTTSFDPKMRGIHTSFSPQLALYRLCLQAHIDQWASVGAAPKRTVVGSIHAIMKKPTIKYCPDTKDKEGFDSYIRRLVEWYAKEEEDNPNNPPMVLDANRFRKPPMTNEFWQRLVRYCKAAGGVPNIDNFYRAGEGACLKYNRPCPYTTLCNSDPAMWPDLIRQLYTISFREDTEEDET